MTRQIPAAVAAGYIVLHFFCSSTDRRPAIAEHTVLSAVDSLLNSDSGTSATPNSPSPPSTVKTGKKNRILQSALNNNRFNARRWLADDHSFPPPGPPGKICRFDPLIKKMARRYGFDWRLVAAQIYAESRFDSTARSQCGARGLMQIMPKTAQHLGTCPLQLENPEVNIATGCMYDRKMVTLWKKNVDHKEEQIAFALASYNAGRGRVLRSFSSKDNRTEWKTVHPLLPEETQDYVHRIALKYDFYSRHALP